MNKNINFTINETKTENKTIKELELEEVKTLTEGYNIMWAMDEQNFNKLTFIYLLITCEILKLSNEREEYFTKCFFVQFQNNKNRKTIHRNINDTRNLLLKELGHKLHEYSRALRYIYNERGLSERNNNK